MQDQFSATLTSRTCYGHTPHIHTHTHTHTHTCVCKHTHTHTHACTCMCMLVPTVTGLSGLNDMPSCLFCQFVCPFRCHWFCSGVKRFSNKGMEIAEAVLLILVYISHTLSDFFRGGGGGREFGEERICVSCQQPYERDRERINNVYVGSDERKRGGREERETVICCWCYIMTEMGINAAYCVMTLFISHIIQLLGERERMCV